MADENDSFNLFDYLSDQASDLWDTVQPTVSDLYDTSVGALKERISMEIKGEDGVNEAPIGAPDPAPKVQPVKSPEIAKREVFGAGVNNQALLVVGGIALALVGFVLVTRGSK